MSNDVVLTNYETVAAEHRVSQINKNGMVLLDPDVEFHRIILDEAHLIKNRKTLTASGVFKLKAKYRLAMSGTPLMNHPDELFSLMHFLRISPYDEWEFFNHHIDKPLKAEKERGARSSFARRRIKNLTQRTMLVRSKKDIVDDKPIIELPEKKELGLRIEFGRDELLFYNALEKKINLEIDRQLQEPGSKLRYFAILLVSLMKLRQACCHQDLLLDFSGHGAPDPDSETLEAVRAWTDSDDHDPTELTRLSSAFPKISSLLQTTAASKPATKKTLTKAERTKRVRMLEEDYRPSAKITKTLELLAAIREAAPREKIIIFSFFTSFLDILQIALNRAGGFTYGHGTMTTAAKDAVVADFVNAKSKTTILLTSLKSGNAGLNLNIANHVIIIEPYWNPYVEMQAIDRAHRIGQTRPVTVYKMLIPNTVEVRILEIQGRKKMMVDLAVGTGDSQQLRQQRKEMAGLTQKDVLDLLRPQAGPAVPEG